MSCTYRILIVNRIYFFEKRNHPKNLSTPERPEINYQDGTYELAWLNYTLEFCRFIIDLHPRVQILNASPAHFYYTLWKYNYGLSTTIQTHCSSPGLYPNYSNLVVSYSLSNCYCNTSLDDSNYGLLEYDFASLLVFQIPPYKGGIFFL